MYFNNQFIRWINSPLASSLCCLKKTSIFYFHLKEIRINTGLDGFYGWGGFGGSQMQWSLEEKIGFAYVPTYLFWIDITNGKGRDLQKEVVRCVHKLKNN